MNMKIVSTIIVSAMFFISACDDQGVLAPPIDPPSNAPTIVSLSPASGSVGDTITIKGTKFGSVQGSSTISFGSVAATSIGPWSDTLIKTIVPVNAATGNVSVKVNGLSSAGKQFTVLGTVPAVSFDSDVLPLFTTTYGCTGCHGGQNNLFLESYPQVMAGNSINGPVIIVGNASGSILVKKLRTATLPFGARMPFGATSQVSDADLQKIVDWINQGAKNN
ncbi:MAG: IPT/TIG domain-containing protein [Bacteroidota bacterium]|nr:IPT/TIG domain-containing protein [Bacteroidota bacterium]